MYYKERIIGVLTYGILLLFFAFVVKKSKKSPKKALMIYTVLLSILAYFYIPNPGYDLERIYITLSQYYKPMNSYALIELLTRSFTPTINIFYYFISKTDFYGIAPFTVSMIFYSCVFSIYNDLCEKYDINGYKRSLFLIFIMSLGTYLEVITNIRCMTAFAMITYCIYNEVFNKKSLVKHLPIYFIAGTIHLAALAIIILRVAIYPLQKKKWKIFYSLIPITILGIIYIFYPSFVNQILFTESYYKEHVTYSYLPEFILMSIMTIYIVFIKLMHWKSIMVDDSLKYINFFSFILLAIILLNIGEYSIFHRIGTLHFLINIPLMAKYLSLLKKRGGVTFMFIISAIILFIAGIYGNLCGFKFFIFN
ncbi:MAG: EpsG family protein [Bacilli bacterium]|nr:EpsG family protein [Bacilli bacterium]MBR6137144.1 EpsG family protein [Bacilli bacterium]